MVSRGGGGRWGQAVANGDPIIATTFVAYDHFFHVDASGLITPSD